MMEHSKVDSIIQLAGDLAAKADDIEDVLVIYSKKNGGYGSLDTDMTVSDSMWFLEVFKYWLLTAMEKEHGI